MASAGVTGFSLHGLSLFSWRVLVYLNDGGGVPGKYGHRKGLSKARLTSGIPSLWPLSLSQSRAYGQPRAHGKGQSPVLEGGAAGSCYKWCRSREETKWSHFCIQLPATVDFPSFLIVKFKVNQKRFTRYLL